MPHDNRKLNEIISTLTKDAMSLHPKYPPQALYAIQDEMGSEILGRRFEQGIRLRNVRALEYGSLLGLNRICFEFDGLGPKLGNNDLLMLIDENCRVVGYVDPFDSRQQNHMVPPLAALS